MAALKLLFLAGAGLAAGSVTAQEAVARPAIVETLDLAVSRPPELVPVAGKLVLVFETHLTNLLRVTRPSTGST